MLAAVAIGCEVWAFLSLLNGSSDVLDSVLFSLAGCSFGLVVLQQGAPGSGELKLADFEEDLTFEPVYGPRSVFWRRFRPELVSYSWLVLSAIAGNSTSAKMTTAQAKKPKLKLATN